MATRMQQRRGTAAEWLNADPILAEGEIGFETDTGYFKIGDGTTFWFDLPYFQNSDGLGASLDDYILLTQKASANGVATLDSTGNVPFSQLGNVPVTDLAGYATETYVNTTVSNLIDSAPGTLDTLNELAAALNDDANFATTVTNSLASKANTVHTHAISDVTSLQTELDAKAPLASPTFTGNVNLPATTTIDGITSTELSYLNGVTSPIQTQLGDKADLVHTHVMADITDVITTATELNYVSGVTSAIQTQIDAKADTFREEILTTATGFAGYTYNVKNDSVQYITANSTANGTVNFRGSDTVTMNSFMSDKQSVTCVLLVTNGATPYRPTAFQIDGVSVTPKWQGGTAPTSGNANSIDVYTFTIIKTATATYTLLASQTKFAEGV